MIQYFKNNNAKIKWLLENVFYPENFDKEYIGKTNLDQNDIIQITKTGTFPDYINYIKNKPAPKISSTEITLGQNEDCLQVIFWYNTCCLDTSNFQNGILNNKNHMNNLRNEINKLDPKHGKIILFMSGNIIGKEWEVKNLINATTDLNKSDEKEEIRRIYYGLKKRKERIINDIKLALKFGVSEVYLMKGVEEFNVLKKTGIDVLQDITDKFDPNKVKNLNNVRYYEEDKKVKYVSEGTVTKVNLVKKNRDGTVLYNTIKIHNIKPSNSENPAVMESKERYLYESSPDASFICGGNFSAAVKNRNEFYPSGQCMYMNTVKGKVPRFMTNNANLFQIYPEASNCLTVVKGGRDPFEENLPLIMNIYNERQKTVALGQYLEEMIKEKSGLLLSLPLPAEKIISGENIGRGNDGRDI